MEEEIISVPELPETVEVVDIQFRSGQKVYYFEPGGHTVKAGDHVIIDTARGPEYGMVTVTQYGKTRLRLSDRWKTRPNAMLTRCSLWAGQLRN